MKPVEPRVDRRPFGIRPDGELVRVGHKGAAALAPENTLESIGVALEHGVDMVEFDVVAAADGSLRLGHSVEELAPDAPTLAQALSFIAREAPTAVLLDVDLKGVGFERDVVGALDKSGLTGRAIVCSVDAGSLRAVRATEPALATGISYPFDRRGVTTRPGLGPAVRAGTAGLRVALPYRIEAMVERAEASAAMLHHSVVSWRAVARCRRRGVPVFAWTVDDTRTLAHVVAAGVAGVITNDPRIFASRGSLDLSR